MYSISIAAVFSSFKSAMENYENSSDYEMEYNNDDQNEYHEKRHEEFPEESSENIQSSETSSITANISTKKQRSWVWNYFTIDETTNKPQCNICKAFVTASKGSTTAM